MRGKKVNIYTHFGVARQRSRTEYEKLQWLELLKRKRREDILINVFPSTRLAWLQEKERGRRKPLKKEVREENLQSRGPTIP